MIDEPDIALVGCVPCDLQESLVPSDVVQCHKCGTDLWLSHGLITDLVAKGHARENILALCLYTCIVVPADAEVQITDGQRTGLRARGLTDEQIDEGLEIADLIVQREE
jgi:hypothetical protein